MHTHFSGSLTPYVHCSLQGHRPKSQLFPACSSLPIMWGATSGTAQVPVGPAHLCCSARGTKQPHQGPAAACAQPDTLPVRLEGIQHDIPSLQLSVPAQGTQFALTKASSLLQAAVNLSAVAGCSPARGGSLHGLGNTPAAGPRSYFLLSHIPKDSLGGSYQPQTCRLPTNLAARSTAQMCWCCSKINKNKVWFVF